MGTRFIASRECLWHDNYKQALVDAEQVIGIQTSTVPNSNLMRAVLKLSPAVRQARTRGLVRVIPVQSSMAERWTWH